MGGLYHPTAKGIIDGQKVGLKNSTDIVHYIFDLEDVFENLKIPEPYTSPGIEYYIGFGNGYEKGQQLRKLLENNTDTRMSSDEKIECCEYLLHKDEICRTGMQKKIPSKYKTLGLYNFASRYCTNFTKALKRKENTKSN